MRRGGDGGWRRRRRHGTGAGAGRRGRLEVRRRRRGRGHPAREGAVERPQAVPPVARQLTGERRAGEPAPRVHAQEVQQRLGLGGGPAGARAGLGVASFPVAARPARTASPSDELFFFSGNRLLRTLFAPTHRSTATRVKWEHAYMRYTYRHVHYFLFLLAIIDQCRSIDDGIRKLLLI